jgi:hypothetical protein
VDEESPDDRGNLVSSSLRLSEVVRGRKPVVIGTLGLTTFVVPEVEVRWKCLKARILHGTSHGEVIEALPVSVSEAETGMHGIVKEAADTSCCDPNRLGFQVEQLTNESCLPKKSWVQPRSHCPQGVLELSEHPD